MSSSGGTSGAGNGGAGNGASSGGVVGAAGMNGPVQGIVIRAGCEDHPNGNISGEFGIFLFWSLTFLLLLVLFFESC